MQLQKDKGAKAPHQKKGTKPKCIYEEDKIMPINLIKGQRVELDNRLTHLKVEMGWKVNLRTLVNFFGMRLCSRAYWEMRDLTKDLKEALENYSNEWRELSDALFVPKCELIGYCTEVKSCHLQPSKKEVLGLDNI